MKSSHFIAFLRVLLLAGLPAALLGGAAFQGTAQASGPYTAVSVGGYEHTCALTAAGGVKCWGGNSTGQLGIGTGTNSPVALDVVGLTSGVIAISSGNEHTCALTAAGGVKCWGNSNYGQLGDGTYGDSSLPVDVSGLSSGVTAISAGGFHTCALIGGAARCWGSNVSGELGDGSNVDSAVPVDVSGLGSGVSNISAGDWQTCAVVSGGAKCWGFNSYYQLGDGTGADSNVPVDVSGLSSGVSAIATGVYQSCALTHDGAAKCWGYNAVGQLGDGSNDDSKVPVDVTGLGSGVSAISVGDSHVCAIVGAGGVKCWGDSLGNGTWQSSNVPLDVHGLTGGASAISAGGENSCALVNGGIRCWGDNRLGQVGDGEDDLGRTPRAVSGLASGVAAISTGERHACALTGARGVQCWGNNSFGQLGDGTTTGSNVPVDVSGLASGISAVSATRSHTCALADGGAVWCWGDNGGGQLGNGTTTDSSVPVDVTGIGTSAIAIAAGSFHTCVLTGAGGVKCWGENWSGQLGDGTYTPSNLPVDVSGMGSSVIAIAAGSDHTCALTSAGGVKCWGDGMSGQLGNGASADSNVPVPVSGLTAGVSAIATGNDHACALTGLGGVKCWGFNLYGELGNGTWANSNIPVDVSGLTGGAKNISAGSSHTCALAGLGVIKCWGGNDRAQLGDGTTTDSLTPVDVIGLPGSVSAIALGFDFTCALAGGGVQCWGDDYDGQLGDAHLLTNVPVAVIEGPAYASNPPGGASIDLGFTGPGVPASADLSVRETGGLPLQVSAYSIEGPDAPDFSLTAGAPPFSIADGGVEHLLTVQCLSGDEGQKSATLNLTHNGGGLPASYPLTCSVDTPAQVFSSVPADPNPTAKRQVRFTVTFTKPVSGVTADDFSLATGPITNASVTAVQGSDAVYTVTVNTGSGSGTLRLNVIDNDSIKDAASNPLGGKGAGNGDFTTGGQFYTVNKTATLKSIPAQDGWVLESSEKSAVGGSLNSAAVTFNLGDDTARRQYRAILSFNTGAALPDKAVITGVTLKLKKYTIVGGGNPVAIFQGFLLDIKNGFFGTAVLQAGDFQAAGSKSFGPFSPAAVSNWYSFDLTAARGYVNKLAANNGLTQIRLRFKLDDNNNAVANLLSLYSGNAGAANRPQLIIQYYVP